MQPIESPNPPSQPLARMLAANVHDAPAAGAAVFGAAATTAVVSLLTPAAIARTIDAAVRGRGGDLVLLAALLAAGAAARVVSGVAAATYAADVAARIRTRVVAHVLAAGPFALRAFPTGQLVSRVTLDAEAPGALLPAVASSVVSVATAVGAVVMLALLDWRLAATLLASLPVIVAIVRAFMSRAPTLYRDYERAQSEIAARLVDAHAGARTIRAAGTAERELDRVLEPLAELRAAGFELWGAQRRVTWQAGLLVALAEVVVLAVAGLRVSAGVLSPGDFVAAAAYVALALAGLEQVETLVHVAQTRVAAARVGEILHTPRSLDAGGTQPLRGGRGAIRFDGVTVVDGAHHVLAGVTFAVAAGTNVAIVGASGAGKSTVAELVGRLRDPDAGTVSIDDVPLRDVDLRDVRRAVGYAFERPAAVGETIHGLIALGSSDASRAAVERAARDAEAASFVARLPHGYDTLLEDAPLSGGEWQRLGLARALLSDARIVVLDDATSSLDSATEARVSAALAAALRGRTSVVVAHRATTAAHADVVVWLDEGCVRGVAPHAVLWRDAAYRGLFEPQARVVEQAS